MVDYSRVLEYKGSIIMKRYKYQVDSDASSP